MNNLITGSNPLILEARDARDKLSLLGGHDRLLAKIDDLLLKSQGAGLHGGEQAKLKNLLAQVGALK